MTEKTIEQKYQEMIERAEPTLEKLQELFKNITEADRTLDFLGAKISKDEDGCIRCEFDSFYYDLKKKVSDIWFALSEKLLAKIEEK